MPAPSQRFPWIVVSAVSSAAVVGVAAWLQVPHAGDMVADRSGELPLLGFARSGASVPADIMAEQIVAYDPTPMFVPSAMSNSDPALPEDSRPGAAGPFGVLPPALTKDGPVRFPAAVAVPDSPIGALRFTERTDASLAITRTDGAGPPLTARAAKIEIVGATGGKYALELELPSPQPLLSGEWQPLELMGAVTRAGLVGELIVTGSSGVDEIDEFFRSHLRQNLRVGARLKAGFYVFHVGH